MITTILLAIGVPVVFGTTSFWYLRRRNEKKLLEAEEKALAEHLRRQEFLEARFAAKRTVDKFTPPRNQARPIYTQKNLDRYEETQRSASDDSSSILTSIIAAEVLSSALDTSSSDTSSWSGDSSSWSDTSSPSPDYSGGGGDFGGGGSTGSWG